MLERVARILLDSDDKEQSERALKYARKYEESVRALMKDAPANPRQKAQFIEEYDRAIGRALALQARATGNLGKVDEAAALAIKSFETYPSHESAREAGKWLARAGKGVEAARRYADAFVAPDSTAELRAKDRALMSEQYREGKGLRSGLWAISCLEAHDRAVTLGAKTSRPPARIRSEHRRENPMEYTLTGIEGRAAQACRRCKGKVIVMDFWATWCGPCRVQHPLYEQVKKQVRRTTTT